MTERILVPFAGEGAGVEELTWGQKGMWQTIVDTGESKTMGGVDVLKPGTTVADAVAALRFVVSRHQSLRTRLRFGADGYPRQEVASSGEVPLEVVEAGDTDPAEAAAAVCERYETTPFDYANEWPVRMAIVTRHGIPTHAVAIYLHLALDAHGLGTLMADLSTMDPRTGGPTRPVTGIQPLDLARQQRRPAARRQGEASLAHLEHVLRTAPPSRFNRPPRAGEPSYRQIGFRSPATLLAIRAIAARHAVGTTPVLLAAFATVLARTVGTNPVVTMLAVSNRFRPGFDTSVTLVAQVSPCLLDVADVGFAEAVARTARAAMHAYKHAYYNPIGRVQLIARVSQERGEQIDLSCFFNDRRMSGREQPTGPIPTAAEIRQAVPLSTARPMDQFGLPQQKLYLSVNDVHDAVDITMSADTRYLSPAQMEELLREMEAVTVEAATEPTDRTGVQPRSASVP
jgi:hypothetical protein